MSPPAPLRIKSVIFPRHQHAKQWAVVSDFGGKANQFQTTPQCGGPFGPNSTFCVTIIKPVPLGNHH